MTPASNLSLPLSSGTSTKALGTSATGLDGGPRYCLLGTDHHECPRTYAASPLALQRTELLEWVARGFGAGGAALSGGPAPGAGSAGPYGAAAGVAAGAGAEAGAALGFPALLPYKLLYAHTLAEYGRIPDALAYAQVGNEQAPTVALQWADFSLCAKPSWPCCKTMLVQGLF